MPARMLLVIATFLLALAPGQALAAQAPLDAGSSKRTVAEVIDYWTPKRMANAQDLDLVTAGPDGQARSEQPQTQSGAVGYTSTQLTDTTSFPNRVHGKVFFTRPGSGNYVCSGTAVTSQNRSTVITAGHCVHSAGAWSTNFAFAPGYRNLSGSGNAPYGVWGASDESAPTPWVSSENLKYDVGAVVIARNSSGQTVQDVVGARGIAFNQPTTRSYRSYGYPAVAYAGKAFDGTRLWACDSNPPTLDNPGGSGPSTLGIGCDMTGGSSGGGWVMTDSSGSYVNGVNSYKYSSQPEQMYGPYFGSTAKALYDFASAEPPGAPGSSGAGNSIPDADSAKAPGKAGCRKVRKRASARTKRAAKRACRAKR